MMIQPGSEAKWAGCESIKASIPANVYEEGGVGGAEGPVGPVKIA